MQQRLFDYPQAELDFLLPKLRRLYRRFTESHLPTRVVAHLSVVSLVALASAAGIAQAQGSGSTSADARSETGFPSIVSAVRAGGVEAAISTPSTYSLTAVPDDLVQIDRGATAQLPAPEPLPTPVAIDPNATPLAAPSSIGGVATGVTSRGVAPAPAVGGLLWPVPGGSISQYFHAGHLAVDIAAPYGSQVVAAQSGIVTSAGWRNNGGGNVIQIDHGNGLETVYNHLGSIWVSPERTSPPARGSAGSGAPACAPGRTFTSK